MRKIIKTYDNVSEKFGNCVEMTLADYFELITIYPEWNLKEENFRVYGKFIEYKFETGWEIIAIEKKCPNVKLTRKMYKEDL